MKPLRDTMIMAALGLAATAFVPGCGSELHPNDIPATATLNSEGTGRIVYTVPSAGTVYVYDDSTNRMVYSGSVQPGQRVIVDPRNDRIDLDNRKVSDQTLHNGDSYQIYFDRSTSATVDHRGDMHD